jgi:hypothetical protein
MTPTDRQRIYAAISDAFYDARNAGRTMTDAANAATDAVVAIVESAPSTTKAESGATA